MEYKKSSSYRKFTIYHDVLTVMQDCIWIRPVLCEMIINNVKQIYLYNLFYTVAAMSCGLVCVYLPSCVYVPLAPSSAVDINLSQEQSQVK